MEETGKFKSLSNWDFINKGYVDYVDNWFLMSSPIVPTVIIAVYLLFVLRIGPAYMKDRPAYSLRNVIHIYNALQVLYSGYMVSYGCRILLHEGFLERRCLLENKEHTYWVVVGGYTYLIGKLSELSDTVFFVLRKKWNQISFLHVYHHSVMFSVTWLSLKYSPSYMFAFITTLNSFVHVIMYTYYGLSAFPELTKYLWWKKYITKLQLVQFFLGLVTMTINFFKSICPQSYFFLILGWLHCILFTYLFAKFYVDNYLANRQNAKNGFAKDSSKLKERDCCKVD